MKHFKCSFPVYILITLAAAILTSCIQDELPNSEADIEKCILPKSILQKPEIDVTKSFDSDLNAYPVFLPVKEGVDITALAPEFELTEGATIEPLSGSVHNFKRPVRYTVTSEDGKWHRTYALMVENKSFMPDVFHFEQAKKNGKYHIIYENNPEFTLEWASGNAGFAWAVSTADTFEYPTFLSPDGYSGNCAAMVTRSTGDMGAMVKMPIAAGNLFLGHFNMGQALSKPLEATRFGLPFTHKPLRLKGHYQYSAGKVFTENGKVVNKKDIFNIYAIFFESTDEVPVLDGNIQIQNFEHPNMVAVAVIDNPHETEGSQWATFDIKFDYERYGKTIDPAKLNEGKYYLSIVCASSAEGATFCGAVGSTLLVDEMELIYE